MDMSKYRNRPDYTTELHLYNGKTELIRHCGACLSIIWKEVCTHCYPPMPPTAEKVNHD